LAKVTGTGTGNVVRDLEMYPLHLGLGAKAIPLPPITGLQWYDEYSAHHSNDGPEGRLVSLFRFTESWDSWEMHPLGDEVISGETDYFAAGESRNNGYVIA